MAEKRQVLAVLAGDRRILQALPEDSLLRRHWPYAQAAIEAYCGGEIQAMRRALAAIPFRSPYRDLRFLLGALAAYPERIEEGRALLARISRDSPFACPAQAVAVLFGEDEKVLKPAARSFVDTLRGRAKTTVEPEQLFPELLEAAKGREDPGIREALKALLIDYPAGLTAYSEQFGPLSPVEENRRQALAAEQAEAWEAAIKIWADAAESYRQNSQYLEAAAVNRHLARLTERLAGPEDSQVAEYLHKALALDLGHRDTWLQLAHWYRKAEKSQHLGRLLDDALEHFPDDSAVLEAAAEAAIDRGVYKKAARLTRRLLKLDPINSSARRRLVVAHLRHARKQIAAGKHELAVKEIQAAADLARTPKEAAKAAALKAGLRLLEGEMDPLAGMQPPLPSPQWECLVAAEVLRLELPPRLSRPQLKRLRQVLDVSAMQIDKAAVTGLLDLLVEAVAEGVPAADLFKPIRPYLQKGASLDWLEEELIAVCERFLCLEQYQLICDYVRASFHWGHRPPALVYFDAVARGRGSAADLNPHDIVVLQQALETAKHKRQHRWAARIEDFLEEYEQSRVIFDPWKGGFPREAPVSPQISPKEVLAKLLENFFPQRGKK
ncbi:tetratricopeptide repeat protein [Methylohalobius crimeensis]|uniref:hypothetical protein n=1 Tax=Methylohalobius crimeensis TaxID=244365 RepID=UPI0003B7603E|nr:hypothetical protein [Methylohalobius crimeensis]